MSLAILFHFLCAQHVSDINISIRRSLRLFCWITIVHWSYCSWFDVCWSFCVVGLEWYPCCRLKHKLCFSLQHGYHSNPTIMSETCWAHKKWNKIASDIKLVFYSSIKVTRFIQLVKSKTFHPIHRREGSCEKNASIDNHCLQKVLL